MKRFTLTIIYLIFYCSIFAYDIEIKGIFYNLNYEQKTAEVTYKSSTNLFNSYANHVIMVPEITYEGVEYRVTKIGDNAFRSCTTLCSISIPNTVTSIGTYAFCECKSLASIVIPNGVVSVGTGAFYSCTNLQSITIPTSVTNFGERVFSNCTSLASIVIPNSVTSFGIGAFWGCKSLTSISIPNSVTSIEENAFDGCTSLTSITITNGVTTIGDRAFSNCTSLTSISIPNSVTHIGTYAFGGCESLTSLTFPNTVTSIGDFAVSSCPYYLVIHVPSESVNRFKEMAALRYVKVVGDAKYEDTTPINPSHPPLLALVDNSLTLVEANNNQTIDANESCKIRFQVTNRGKGPAIGCEAKIVGTGSTIGLTYASQKLPTIAIGVTQAVEIPVTADMNTQDGTVTFSIEVTEPNGFGVPSMDLTVNTRAFDAPMLKVVDYAVSGNGTIQKMQPFDLQLLLQNTNYGKAEDVYVTITLPTGVFLWNGNEKIHYATINGGVQQKLDYQLAISGNYIGTTVPVQIAIKEKYGRFAENKTITLALNQQLASSASVTLQGEADPTRNQRGEIAIGTLGSAVDKNIPVSNIVNKNTFVVIIANENYMSVASVPYALNDGMKFKEYCQKTLGIPEKNIKYIANATGNQIKAQVTWLESITNVFDDPNIIFYYAGHGIPDEASKTAYLLPVDGIGTDVTTGYKLDDLYATLGNMPSAHTTIFLDACFSGSKREEGMLASARGIAIKAKSGVPQGNMVVFSAAQGDETAYPNNEESHGMFTYYLLKKLQETAGDVTLEELGNYITKNVSQQSILINGKSQTPCVKASSTLGTDWYNWKLK